MFTNETLSFSFKDLFNPKKELTPVSKKKTSRFAGAIKKFSPKLLAKGKELFMKKFGGGGAEEAAAPAAGPGYAPEAAPAGGGLPKWAIPVGIGAVALVMLPKLLKRK